MSGKSPNNSNLLKFNIVVCGDDKNLTDIILRDLKSEQLRDTQVAQVHIKTSNVSDPAKIAEEFAFADMVVLAIGADKGIDYRAKRVAALAGLYGVRNIALAIFYGESVECDQQYFNKLSHEFEAYWEKLPTQTEDKIQLQYKYQIPLAISNRETIIPTPGWYDGPSILEIVNSAARKKLPLNASLRMSIENVKYHDSKKVLASGTITAGEAISGAQVVLLPSGKMTVINSILINNAPVQIAHMGDEVELEIAPEIEVTKGDLICDAKDRVQVADQFEAMIISKTSDAILPGRPYEIQPSNQTATATISELKYLLDVDSLEKLAANQLNYEDISVCNISLDKKIPFEPYKINPHLGKFNLVDKSSGETFATGIIHFALHRSQNVHWQSLDVTRNTRAKLKGQKPVLLWFTGLSGSGKSAIANIIDKKLTAMGRHTFTLDGDNVRLGLNKDLGFTDVDRVENIRRIGEVAKLMSDAGLITLVSFISPFHAERQLARNMVAEGEFIEIHVNTPLEVAESRDVKGLYKKAREGKLKNFTGIDSPYEVPENPEIRVDTSRMSAQECAEKIIDDLHKRAII